MQVTLIAKHSGFSIASGLSCVIDRAWVWLPVLCALVCDQATGVCCRDWGWTAAHIRP